MDEQLREIRDWWTNHSQDYQSDHKKEYRSPDLMKLNDFDFKLFIAGIDKEFTHKAYFAQTEITEPFSNFLRGMELKGKRVLEVGCGLGFHSELIARAGGILTAIDLSEKSVQVTQRRLQSCGLEGKIVQADAEKLPFDDNSFDIIWSWGVIHHSPNTTKAASEMQRVLTSKGKLRIMLYNDRSLYKYINVYLRYGIIKAKFMKYGKQELKNMYTDGKEFGGAPLSKYFSKNEVVDMFAPMKLKFNRAYEQKTFATFFVPSSLRKRANSLIPNNLYTRLFSKLGFLGYYEFEYE